MEAQSCSSTLFLWKHSRTHVMYRDSVLLPHAILFFNDILMLSALPISCEIVRSIVFRSIVYFQDRVMNEFHNIIPIGIHLWAVEVP